VICVVAKALLQIGTAWQARTGGISGVVIGFKKSANLLDIGHCWAKFGYDGKAKIPDGASQQAANKRPISEQHQGNNMRIIWES
jgi:hypothetical protein